MFSRGCFLFLVNVAPSSVVTCPPSRAGVTAQVSKETRPQTSGQRNEMNAVVGVYLSETSFAHMARTATKASAEGIAKWIAEHVDLRRKYKPPKEARNIRKERCHERRALPGRHYQLLSGRAAIGSYLCDKIKEP